MLTCFYVAKVLNRTMHKTLKRANWILGYINIHTARTRMCSERQRSAGENSTRVKTAATFVKNAIHPLIYGCLRRGHP